MDETTAKLLIDLIEGLREVTFDANFCLEILKQDKEIEKFYEKCKKKFDEQKTQMEKEEE